jgi:hypothetical protein
MVTTWKPPSGETLLTEKQAKRKARFCSLGANIARQIGLVKSNGKVRPGSMGQIRNFAKIAAGQDWSESSFVSRIRQQLEARALWQGL